MFCDLKQKNFTYAVENADTYLKLLIQKRFLEIFHSETVIFDLSQTSISKNERIGVFQDLRKKTSLMRLKTNS